MQLRHHRHAQPAFPFAGAPMPSSAHGHEERDIPTRRTADVQLRGGVHGRVYCRPPAPGRPRCSCCSPPGTRCRVVVLATCPDTDEQAVATVEWAADHASELDATATPLLVGGDPELVAAVLARAHDRGWPAIQTFLPGTDEFRDAVRSSCRRCRDRQAGPDVPTEENIEQGVLDMKTDRSRWLALYVLCAGMLMIVLDARS